MALTKITGEGVGTIDTLHTSGTGQTAKFESSNNGLQVEFNYNNSTSRAFMGTFSNGLSLAPSSASTAINIDSSGRVTMLNQPCFVAHGSSVTASGNVFLFQQVIQNVGSHYSTSTGRFTAPIAGTYIFYFSAIGSNTNDTYRYYTRKNGTVYPHANTQVRIDTIATGSEYGYGTSAIIMDMAASDYAEIYFASDSSNASHGSSTSGHEIFSGYLLF